MSEDLNDVAPSPVNDGFIHVYVRTAAFVPGHDVVILRDTVAISPADLRTMKVKLSVAALLKVSPMFERMEKAVADEIGDAIK